ncbi:MAG: hypothetical protein AAF743_16555 [Planctomycetota bacterium]
MRSTSFLLAAILLIATGCTGASTYQVRGLGALQTLDAGDTMVVERDGLGYSIARNASGLSVVAFNAGDVAVTLVEPGSVTVDPDGRRHALVRRSLLPGTSTRFDLPPRVTGALTPTEDVSPDRAYDEPGILLGPRGGATPREREATWRWFGGTARLLLVWKPDSGETVRHELAFEKRRE